MQIKPFICTVLWIAFFGVASAQNFESAGEYLSYINQQQETVTKKFLSYNSAVSHGRNAKKVENLRSKLLDEVQEARMNINSMPSFKGDKTFRDSAVSFMKLYYNVLNDDYGKIVNMQEIAEQSYDLMEAYLLAEEMVSKKLSAANDAVIAAQKKFAEKNNIQLTEGKSDVGDMMHQVGEVNHYYNTIYLLFFKSYKQETYMLDAIEKKNLTAIEQNRSALLQVAQAGLTALNAIQPYKGDNSLVNNCRQTLEFHVKEANEKINTITDFLLTQEKFSKIKADFEKKSSPTQEEVDAYNKGVKDINTAANAYNATNKQLTEQRNKLLNDWNEGVNAFMDSKMPVYQ
jgi:predicted DNA-binding protein